LNRPLTTSSGVSSITVTFINYRHLFTRAEDDVDLFEKMEQDLMVA
jgi:hypothetical protein